MCNEWKISKRVAFSLFFVWMHARNLASVGEFAQSNKPKNKLPTVATKQQLHLTAYSKRVYIR